MLPHHHTATLTSLSLTHTVERDVNCKDPVELGSLRTKCTVSCPTDLTPYHECVASREIFACLCIERMREVTSGGGGVPMCMHVS